MEDKTYYGLEGGTLVAATTPRGKPAPGGMTAEDVEWLLSWAEKLEVEADMAISDESKKYSADYYRGFRDALHMAILRINVLEHKPTQGGDQA